LWSSRLCFANGGAIARARDRRSEAKEASRQWSPEDGGLRLGDALKYRTKNQAASFGTSSIGSGTFLGAEEEHRGQCSFSYFLRDIPHFMQSPEMKSNL
jgi:hypothetical protein